MQEIWDVKAAGAFTTTKNNESGQDPVTDLAMMPAGRTPPGSFAGMLAKE
ncbi:MAG: hypothetical protein GX681_03120 [Clostridiaceae bacterium]|nr:hypothetical protein [Clostridiaceae bacterium]